VEEDCGGALRGVFCVGGGARTRGVACLGKWLTRSRLCRVIVGQVVCRKLDMSELELVDWKSGWGGAGGRSAGMGTGLPGRAGAAGAHGIGSGGGVSAGGRAGGQATAMAENMYAAPPQWAAQSGKAASRGSAGWPRIRCPLVLPGVCTQSGYT